MQKAIEVENLKVRYRTKKGNWLDAVHELSFSVEPGEVVGFLGPNGAGKSSTIKALMGFVSPVAGRCTMFGLPAGSLEAKSRVGYLPEVALYYPFLTPVETLVLYGELQGLSGKSLRREALELLELVGLASSMNKQNRSLSKGMLQRVGIAQSLLGNPELLILDEVTSGLDPVGRKELRTLLKERQRNGTTLFFSSHELSEVDMLCDRILLIHQGHLVEERLMEPLKDSLRQYELIYTASTPISAPDAEVRLLGEHKYELKFVDKNHLVEALARVTESGGKVLDVISQEGSLEDYFIDTIRRAA